MQIMYINNEGGGFADFVDVEEGTTISAFFAKRMRGADPSSFLIRVNRQPTNGDYALQPGDRVTITPVKIDGAG